MSAAGARAVAADALGVLADLVAAGAEASGAFAEAELLRAIHACRSEGLHRLAAAQTRALRSIRELRADRPEFALAALTADVRDALAVAPALAAGAAEPALLGTARRGYQPIGPLRLFGICTEAIVARSGFGGAVTYLVDERGALYTRADVGPGEAGRAVGTYAAADVVRRAGAAAPRAVPPRAVRRGGDRLRRRPARRRAARARRAGARAVALGHGPDRRAVPRLARRAARGALGA